MTLRGVVSVLAAWLSIHAACAAGAAREAFVTNQLADSVSVVDLATMRQAAEIKVSGHPAGIALSPDRSEVYVTAPDGKELIAIDAEKRVVDWRLAVGEGPLGIAVNPRTGIVYVANWYGDEIVAVDPSQRAIVGKVKVGRAPSGVAVTPDGTTILSADRESDAVSLIDAATLTRSGEVRVGTHPFGLSISADGERAFVANVISNDVSIIDLSTRKTVATVKVGTRPYGVALAQGKAFVTNQGSGSVSVFDPVNGEQLTALRACDYPEGIEATADEAKVYVACWADNVLVRIDVGTLKVDGSVAVGDGPRAFGAFLR